LARNPPLGPGDPSQVPLLAHGIGLAQPLADSIVELLRRFDPELVDMVSGRDRLDSAKPWILQAPGEDLVPVEPAFLEHHRREAHPDLEGDPRLLRHNGHPPAGPHHPGEAPVERDHCRRFPGEVPRQPITAAGMRLIDVGEAPTHREYRHSDRMDLDTAPGLSVSRYELGARKR